MFKRRIVLQLLVFVALAALVCTGLFLSSSVQAKTIATDGDYTISAVDGSGNCKFTFAPTTASQYVIIHYNVNNAGLVNVNMNGSGNNWEFTVGDLSSNASISCFFTYEKSGAQYDTATFTTTYGSNAASSSSGTSSSSAGVTMYTDANFNGTAVTFGIGTYNMSAMMAAGIGNDAVSSIKVPVGFKLTVYQHSEFNGSSKLFASNSSFVGADWNDQVSSFKIEAAKYFIYNRHSNLVLDIENAGGNNQNGANLLQWTCNSGAWQQWNVTAIGNGNYKITSVLNGKAIDVSDLSVNNGANVHVWDYVGGENQNWKINFVDGAYATIVNQLSGKSLDNDAWSTTPGGNVHQWELGNGQANQQWKFVLVDDTTLAANSATTGTTSNSGSGSSGSTNNNYNNNDGSVPQLRSDIAQRDNQMFFQFNNKTNGAYADNQIYWTIIGINPATGKFCYVNPDGQLIQLTTGLNTIQKNGRACANIAFTLAQKNFVYMPDIVSGRMYFSYGQQVYITVNSDIYGNVGYAGPDLNNTQDPNSDVYFEFIEFTITNGEYWGNTTRVDFFSFPVVTRLVGDGGWANSPGDADNYDKTVGDLGTRNSIFSAYQNEVPNEFKGLANSYRIMAPCKGAFNAGQTYGNYFQSYIDSVWNKFSTQDLVFTCQAGTFRARTSGNAMNFTVSDGRSGTIYKPNTQEVLEGKGVLAQGSDIEKVFEAQLCAAFNRGIAHDPANWANSSMFYKQTPSNFYSGFWHNHSYNGLAYGFCYDDVFDYSTLLHYTEPTALVIDLKWN